MGRQLVQQRRLHGRRRPATLIKTEVLARRVVRAKMVVDAIPDPGHVRRLREVVAAAAGLHENIVREMLRYFMRLVLGRR